MNYGIAFTPLVPAPLLWLALATVALFAIFFALARTRGAMLRIPALFLCVLALANPSFTRADRDGLDSVAVVVVDNSPSQNFASRAGETEEIRAALVASLKKIKGLEVRVVNAGMADGETDGTRLFRALTSALSNVPLERVAGAFLITDGRVHDIPPDAAALGFQAPLHALITGESSERDRRIAILAAPRFGIVSQTQTVRFQLDDQGIDAQQANVTIRRDGEVIGRRRMKSGDKSSVDVDIKHAGANIVEIEADALEGELTTVNNRVVTIIDGVRDKLRVLLVSGEPHAGERTWRNLLKSDPGVDLVHFTILRSPQKQDGTPINELSLIAFPTRELFQDKINDFQLIIFDRYYARKGVLPTAYFDNIARYVRAGGAMLVAAGPDYASEETIWRTPLDAVLPAEPVGVTEKPFHARLSEPGKRHPVTRGLEGAGFDPPHWSRFFRIVNTRNALTPPLMTDEDDRPLLLLSRFGEGRVALLLSDHIWLWARGYEGGGPYIDLLRRMSHWLMKEPDLDEESLRLQNQGRELLVLRQTMADAVSAVSVTSPSGKTRELTLTSSAPGEWRAALPADELGLWQATDGTLKALINVGPTNPKEFAEVTSTTATLSPLAQATGGAALRVIQNHAVALPRVVAQRASSTVFHGDGWLGLRMREASVVKVGVLPIFAGISGLLLLLGAFAATWIREAR
ncbi:MAG: hypothetical protein FWD68_13040 [Alphaproteobacteria bacterium]|nr:hypothetical protein [Alphaproteobacteria bacterium]